MSAHAPDPWMIDPDSDLKVWDTSHNPRCVASCHNKSDAAHIVRCVNAHDALVAALEKFVRHVGQMSVSRATFGLIPPVDAAMLHIAYGEARSALAKAGAP